MFCRSLFVFLSLFFWSLSCLSFFFWSLSCLSFFFWSLSCLCFFWIYNLWWPLWYLQTFLVGHCIACYVIYRSDYPFDIFKHFLLVIVLPVIRVTVLITPLISSNFSFWLLYCLSCDISFWLPLWYLQTFLVGQCIACHVIYRSDYHFDIFKFFLLLIVLPVLRFIASDYPFGIFKLFLKETYE